MNFNSSKLRSEPYASSLTLLFFMVLGGIFSIIFGQDNNWDLRNYHFYNAYSYFYDRSLLDIIPAQVQSFFNPLPDILLLLLIAKFKPIIVGAIFGAIHGINYFLIFKMAQIVLDTLPTHNIAYKQYSISITSFRIAILLGIIAFFGPASLNMLGTCYHDNLVSIPLFISLLLQLIALKHIQTVNQRLIIWSGVAAGVAFGLKMTSAIYILGSITTLLIIIPTLLAKTRVLSMYALGGGIGALLSSGFWYLKMWQEYANPVFPWFNNIFKSPELLPVAIRDIRFLPSSILDGLLYPFYFAYISPYSIGQWSFRDIRFALLMILLLIFSGLLIRSKFSRGSELHVPTQSKFILLFVTISYIIWLIQFSIFRYIFVVEGLVFLAIAIILYALFQSKKLSSGVLLGLLLFTFYTGWSPRSHRIPWQDHYINAHIPDVAGLDSSVIILGGARPTSFLIPGFPETTRFIRLESNMHRYFSPESKLLGRIKDLMKSHTGNFYIITRHRFKQGIQTEMLFEANQVSKFSMLIFD